MRLQVLCRAVFRGRGPFRRPMLKPPRSPGQRRHLTGQHFQPRPAWAARQKDQGIPPLSFPCCLVCVHAHFEVGPVGHWRRCLCWRVADGEEALCIAMCLWHVPRMRQRLADARNVVRQSVMCRRSPPSSQLVRPSPGGSSGAAAPALRRNSLSGVHKRSPVPGAPLPFAPAHECSQSIQPDRPGLLSGVGRPAPGPPQPLGCLPSPV